ncbi:DUF2330 domain-containing protein [Streptomyces sp. NPDC059818]|uniref:DUF2330 domain-containing protein n=1 Tax=Streptomyces sp. NPDC059818 TaxID=3346962 RepID=UPI0036682020
MMLVALRLGSLIAPAHACGCGAMTVDRNSRVTVERETSVVSWSGGTEQIVMRLTVRGNAPAAAWIMPVPHRASVELGDAAPYADRKWEYVAIRLAPREKGSPLRGRLDPLRLRFADDGPVYPMRLSRLATTPQSPGLYVPAANGTEPRGALGGAPPEVAYAGRVGAGQEKRAYPALGALTGGKPVFVTAIDQAFPRPELIDGDHELRAAAADTPYRTTYHRTELLTAGPVPAWVLSLLGAGAVAAVPLVVRARRRRPVAPPPVTVPPPLR